MVEYNAHYIICNFFFLRHENRRRIRQRRREKEAIDTGAASAVGKLDFAVYCTAVRHHRRPYMFIRVRVCRQHKHTHKHRSPYRNTFPARKAQRRRLSHVTRTVKSRRHRYVCGGLLCACYSRSDIQIF